MFRTLAVLIAAASLVSLATLSPAQQLVQRRDLSYAIALAIIGAAVEACAMAGLEKVKAALQ
jgi:hypothetical protein